MSTQQTEAKAAAQNAAAELRSSEQPQRLPIALRSAANLLLLREAGNKINNPHAVDEAIDELLVELGVA